jgi:hypothetical protein
MVTWAIRQQQQGLKRTSGMYTTSLRLKPLIAKRLLQLKWKWQRQQHAMTELPVATRGVPARQQQQQMVRARQQQHMMVPAAA